MQIRLISKGKRFRQSSNSEPPDLVNLYSGDLQSIDSINQSKSVTFEQKAFTKLSLQKRVNNDYTYFKKT